MVFQLGLLGFLVFLLAAINFCQGKNLTVKVVGIINCKECKGYQFRSSQASLGLNVAIHCKTRDREMKIYGIGEVDGEGKFNITLYNKIKTDGSSTYGCYAKLHSASSMACPIHGSPTASMKISNSEGNATQEESSMHKIIVFSPISCQSAFFWPFIQHPNITPFPTWPPSHGQRQGQSIWYAPPPSQPLRMPPPAQTSTPPFFASTPSLQPTLPPPVPAFANPSPQPDLTFRTPPTPASQSTHRPAKSPSTNLTPNPFPISNTPPPVSATNSTPSLHPTLPPPVPAFSNPSPQPDLTFRTPPAPTFQSPHRPAKSPSTNLTPNPFPISNTPPPESPKFKHPNPSPTPSYENPSNAPNSKFPPIPLPHKEPPSKKSNAPLSPSLAPPMPIVQNPYPPSVPKPVKLNPPPLPKLEYAILPPPRGLSIPPNYRNPNPIPRAPPVPHLPPMPTAPRKYFNQPKSDSQPPHPSYLSHS